jgi:Zn finger protein HypA/HybF involved in hydrogenase expression
MLLKAAVAWHLVELVQHTSIEDTEDMNIIDRGSKHACPACEIKYYDLRRKVVACPRCGAKPIAPKVSRATRPVRKTGGTAFGRFPNQAPVKPPS